MGHLFRFAARFSRFLEIGAALHKKKPGVTHVRLQTVRAGWVATGAAGFSALVALSLFAVSLGTAGIDDNVASAHTPACPSSIPIADGEFFWTDSNDDHWFIIRQTTNSGHMLSGHTLIRAYVASSSYDAGYVPGTPHETCVLKVRGPDDDEDLDPPVQIFILQDHEDSPDANTEGTRQPSATLSLLQASGNSETAGLVIVGLTTFVYEGTEVSIAIALSNLEPDSDSQTVDYLFRVRVMQGPIINLLCQGTGMNVIQELTTNTGSSIQTATIPGACPAGTYTIEVVLADGDNSDFSDPIFEVTAYLVIGPLASSQQSDQGGGNGQGGSSGQGSSGGGNECGDAERGSAGTPARPQAPSLILTLDTTSTGVEWVAPNDNDSPILAYSVMYIPNGETRNEIDAGGLSEILHGLAAGATYEIRVSACNAVGFGPWSHGATLHTASTPGTSGGNTIGTTNNQWCGIAAQGSDGTPGTPNPPTVTAGGTDSITVQWTAPQDDGGSQIKIYAVQFTQVGISTMVKEPGLSTTLTGLQANTDYSVQVAACNAVGMSAWSAAATVQTDPESLRSGDDGGNGGGGGNGGSGNGGSDGTCPGGEWVGHNHPNDGHYWGGTVDCLAESLIDSIDPAPHGRMWTKSMMSDHRHAGFTDATREGSSCNADHVAVHTSHVVLPCS